MACISNKAKKGTFADHLLIMMVGCYLFSNGIVCLILCKLNVLGEFRKFVLDLVRHHIW